MGRRLPPYCCITSTFLNRLLAAGLNAWVAWEGKTSGKKSTPTLGK